MPKTMYDICAIGNALVDVIADATDDFCMNTKLLRGL
jgi:hypothetical protein